MASFAKTPSQVSMENHHVSILAQAKPVIISSGGSNASCFIDPSSTSGYLSEKLQTVLDLSAQRTNNFFSPTTTTKGGDDDSTGCQKLRHIEDDNVIRRQNASNQMRQAAVMAAVASQHKLRLSATERLAMSAKRPTTEQQIKQLSGEMRHNQPAQHPQPPLTPPQHQPQPQKQTMTTCKPTPSHFQNAKQPSLPAPPPPPPATCNPKPAPLPTLETLLAVQRQLQRHTRQNLTTMPQDLVKDQQKQQTQAGNRQQQQPQNQVSFNKISPPKVPNEYEYPMLTSSELQSEEASHVTSIETYEKELPPLPQSVSPSTCTDESQFNSLESHQSSPATSLVSIPPPPPPISSYLQQYDEVVTSRHSNSSTPSTSSSAEISSIKQFPILPIKQHQITSVAQKTLDQVNGSPEKVIASNSCRSNQSITCASRPTPPPLAPRPQHLTVSHSQYSSLHANTQHPHPNHQLSTSNLAQPHNGQPVNAPSAISQASRNSSGTAQSAPCVQVEAAQKSCTGSNSSSSSGISGDMIISHQQQQKTAPSNGQSIINYQQHVFNPTQSTIRFAPADTVSQSFMPPPPPIVSATSIQSPVSSDVGFDEPDCASFRFPTPPPPNLLLQDETNDCAVGEVYNDERRRDSQRGEDEEDFQCKIPTPPPHKSISAATFQDLDFRQQQQHQNPPKQTFSASSFSVPANPTPPTTSLRQNVGIQPPPLFRQPIANHMSNNHQARVVPQSAQYSAPAPKNGTPQLTVNINDDGGGLLSTADATGCHASVNQHHSHHHRIMMTMTASSPSSSSDGDGHSSNSSSSTSGIHSSIDSPCSSNSKLDEFNYGNKSKQLLQQQHQQQFKQLAAALSTNYLEGACKSRKNSNSSNASSVQQQQGNVNSVTNAAARPRPALKQKKTVSFSDKIELVACAEERCVEYLPNPLLARVLAGKLQ